MTEIEALKALDTHRATTGLAWTLIHSIWQGVLFTIIMGIIISVSKRGKPALRYYLICGLFFLFVFISVFTFCYQYRLQPQRVGFFYTYVKLPSAVYALQDRVAGFTNFGLLLKDLTNNLTSWINRYSAFIAAIWLAVVLVKSLKLLLTLYYTKVIKTAGQLSPLLPGCKN